MRAETTATHKAVIESARAAALAAADAHGAELERAVEHAKARIEKLEAQLPDKAPKWRSQDAWARLSREALRKARYRERAYISSFLESRAWDMAEWATVLDETVDDDGESLLDDLWDTKVVQERHFSEVRLLFTKLEREHWGEKLGMHCRLELNMTYRAMLQLGQAACKEYKADSDFYAPKTLAVNAHNPRDILVVPRIVPPRNRVEPEVKLLEGTLGLEMSENGKITHKSLQRCLAEIITEQDMGKA